LRIARDALGVGNDGEQLHSVAAAGTSEDIDGYVRVDPMTRETLVSGIDAAGDLTTRTQGAILAAVAGTQAAAAINLEVTIELATRRALSHSSLMGIPQG
jgi:thioredoxin reductase